MREPTHKPPRSEGRKFTRRRQILHAIAALGLGGAVFQRAVAAQIEQGGAVSAAMIQQASWIAGLEFSQAEAEQAAASLQSSLRKFLAMRAADIGYDVPPALVFQPDVSDAKSDNSTGQDAAFVPPRVERPHHNDDTAFFSVAQMAALLRSRQVSSLELTQLSLDRLRRFDPQLHCVVSLTEELALKQARRADEEIAAGKVRGPLHGVPWGAKDLISYPGYKTTWGATPFQEQTLATKAAVAERLEQAGAVLVAKLSLGALAQGDRWFGGMTRNPWNLEEGSSGSSAGSAAAVSAGLVGFAIGSETLGSIISPCRRCGVSGLRPTFGRVSRYGCMTLAWSMDKLGPIARTLEDCALVFAAIHGRDHRYAAAVDRPFVWPPKRKLTEMRVGYFENNIPRSEREDLRILQDLGVRLKAISLPDNLPINALTIILNAEAAAAFDELTRAGVTEGLNSWPRAFRQGHLTPAVEYLRANRIRTLLCRQMAELFQDVDLYVGGNDLVLTNMTGHPCAVLPAGFRERDGVETPYAITFTGKLYGESDLLAVASAYQRATGVHLKRPPLKAGAGG